MDAIEKIKSLDIWKNDLTINPLEGGITNLNFLVNHGDQKLSLGKGEKEETKTIGEIVINQLEVDQISFKNLSRIFRQFIFYNCFAGATVI